MTAEMSCEEKEMVVPQSVCLTKPSFDHGGAKTIVEQEIQRLYCQWGSVVNREREDLMQIGLLTMFEIGDTRALGRIAVRNDFSDRLRLISGIRRKDKARLGRRAVPYYVPLEPIRGSSDLSEVELAVHCERQLERLNSNRPKGMACIDGLVSGKNIAQIARQLGITPGTALVHCHHFRRALAC